MAGAAGALAVIALALLLGPTHPAARSPTASRATVAVVPFRVHSPNADLAWLRDGMVELLTMRLSGTGGMTVIEPGRVLAAWHSVPRDSLVEEPAATLARFAGQVGAGRIVCGSVTGTPDHLALAAWIVDVTDGHMVAQATIEGPADSLAFLVDRLSAKLLGLAAGVEGHRL
jgi:TolB-like protein